ncbi:hypothetical protein KI387_040229, partial [Taxus chinensis]
IRRGNLSICLQVRNPLAVNGFSKQNIRQMVQSTNTKHDLLQRVMLSKKELTMTRPLHPLRRSKPSE